MAKESKKQRKKVVAQLQSVRSVTILYKKIMAIAISYKKFVETQTNGLEGPLLLMKKYRARFMATLRELKRKEEAKKKKLKRLEAVHGKKDALFSRLQFKRNEMRTTLDDPMEAQQGRPGPSHPPPFVWSATRQPDGSTR